MRRFVLALTAVAVCTVLVQPALAAGGTRQPSNDTAETETPKTPEELAIEQYNLGISNRDRAWKNQEKLAEATDEKTRAKLTKKITSSYERARTAFERAIEINPMMFQAHSDLGYCLRKLGDYEASLASYDRAIEIEPRYAEAVEYRGETYLALGRLDEAKQAYMQLFGGAREQADKLLEAMRAFVEESKQNGNGGVDSSMLEAFNGWVSEREEIAGQTKSVSQLRGHDW